MADKNTTPENNPNQTDPKPSKPISRLDVMNKKVLELRLKKEEEAEQRRQRVLDKEGKNARKSIRRSAPKEPSSTLSEPLPKGGWSVSFKPPAESLPESQKVTQAPVQPENKQESNQPSTGRVGISRLQLDQSVPQKSKTPAKPKIETDNKPTATVIEKEKDTIPLTSKPGSTTMIKTIPAKPQEPSVILIQKRLSRKSVKITDSLENDNQALGDKPDNLRLSAERNVALFRDSDENLKQQLDLISQPKQKVNEAMLDILKSGKDQQAVTITIIPADESKIIDVEVAEWERNRSSFVILFIVAVISAIVMMAFVLYLSLTYYILDTKGHVKRVAYGTIANLVIHSDSMIGSTVLLTSIGILIFRLFPEANRRAVTIFHAVIFTVVGLIFMNAFRVIIIIHETITGQAENFYSLHSILGLVVCVFLLSEIFTGIYALLSTNPKSLTVKYHSSAGMITFMLSGACCISGYLGRFLIFDIGKKFTSEEYKKTILINSSGLLILLFCCFIRHIATDFRFRARAKPEWDTVFSRTISSKEDDNIDRIDCTLQQYIRRNICMRYK